MTRTMLAAVLVLAGCTGALDDGPRHASRGPVDPIDPGNCEVGARSIPTVSRLTREEYDRTIEALTGDARSFGSSLPSDDANDGLEVGGPVATLVADQLYVAADDVADHVELSSIVHCDPAAIGAETCARETATAFARRAYRRPATSEEIDALMALYREGSSDPALPVGFEDGVRWMISGVLVAPQFLYHEWGTLGGELPAGDALHGYAIASRLSYFLWGTMPDDALLDAAEAGSLDTPEGVALEARRLLDDDRARDGVSSFFRQWLHIDRVGGLSKDGTLFPGFDGSAAADLEGSLHAFTDHAFWQGGYHELEDSPNVWMNGRLTALYAAPGGPTADALSPFELDPGQRAGLLGQPALLAMLATADQGHPIRRGVFVREHVLCQDLRPPPADIATPIPPLDAAPTTRERFAQHSQSPSCIGCHQLIDGIGFSLERFDAIGRTRETEGGLPIDDSGELCSYPDCATTTPVHGQVELAEALSAGTLQRDCITREWLRYAVHAPATSVDRCELSRISAQLGATDDLAELLVAIASSELLGNDPVAVEGGER